MVRAKRKTMKQRSRRQQRRKASGSATMTATASLSGSQSISGSPPTLDIKSSTDVKKALDIMRKHPLTVILVFASWCPHCHTFMERWNKYKSLPNRTSPMIAVEQQQSQQLLNEINGENGDRVNVNAFPTVLASTSSAPSTSKSNVGTTVNTDESSMIELLTNGSNAVSTESTELGEPSESAEELSNNASNLSDPSNASNASNFSESMSSTRKATPFVRSSNLTETIRQAVSAATARRAASAARKQRLTNKGSAEESILSPINGNERFVKPPKRIEVAAMNGGGCENGTCDISTGPSGLIKLSGGGMSPSGSLFEALKTYGSRTHTRKNKD